MKKLILIICFALISISSNAQVEPIAGGMAAKEVVSNLKEQINDIIASLDGVMTKQAFDTKQYLQLLLTQLDYVAGKNINLTFDRLDKTQQDFLTNVNVTLANTETLANRVTANINDNVDNGASLLGTIPGSRKHPTIRRISPSYTLVSNANNFDVDIKGQWLTNKPPYFIINGEKITPTAFQDNLIKHRFTNLVVTDATKVTNQQVELITFTKGFLKKKKKPYKFDIAFIPNQMAIYTVTIVTKTPRRVVQRRSDEVTHRNDHCQGERNVFLTVNATPGWKIDVNSIRDVANVRENSVYTGKRNVTEAGFQCHGYARNSGSCDWPFKDARGRVSIQASWTEYQIVDDIKTISNFASGNFLWTDEKSIQLPPNTESFTLTVKKADGTTSVVSSNKVDKWFNATYNTSSKQLIIRPNNPVAEL